jgi:arylsulfatase A-like enzyme
MKNAKVDRRNFILGGAGLLGLSPLFAGAASDTASRKPNILFILADDMGYADVGCFGARDYRTPNIDRIAAEGLKLPQAYANSSVCSPTRFALITGRYQYRLAGGLHEPIAADRSVGLPPEHPTLPSLLKRVGYRTALVGKWHLGFPPTYGPLKSGYDHFYGIYAGGADYFTHDLKFDGVTRDKGVFENEKETNDAGYMTDLLGDHAVGEIEAAAAAKQPLFLSLHFTAPHWPWEGPEDEAVARTLKDSWHYDGGSRTTYGRMVESLDRNIGRVLAALDSHGMTQDTIVVFTSDNGGERYSDTWPFIGQKGELLEGGIRVPLVMRWPERFKAGATSDQVIASMDFLPTLLAAAGAQPDAKYPSDGFNLLDVLLGDKAPVDRKLYWRFKAGEQAAVREGRMKYVRLGRKEGLFDLIADPRERANLKSVQPELFKRLKSDFAAWNATMLPYPDKGFSQDNKADQAMDRY